MALSIAQTIALGSVLKSGMSVASFGYPDIICPEGLVKEILGEKFKDLAYREDSRIIRKRHGMKDMPVPDSQSFFEIQGCTLDVYDIVEERGGEIICDLNLPMTPRGTYDLVLDVGTVEHVFNIAQAVVNMAQMVKVGGHILHENPFNCGNHGFYSLNPTWYADFYHANGFELVDCQLATRDGRATDVPFNKRFKYVAEEINVFAMAKRIEVREFVYPTQSKYKRSVDD